MIKQYINEINKRFMYLVNHPDFLQDHVQLGYVGKISKYKPFDYFGKLEQFNIPFEIQEPKEKRDNSFFYATKKGFTIKSNSTGKTISDFQLGGLMTSDIKAGFHLEFQKDKAILFQLKDVRIKRIENQLQVGQKVKDIFEGKEASELEWDRRFVVITEIIEAKSARIFMARKKGATIGINLGANASLDFKGKELNLADLNQDFSFNTNSEEVIFSEATNAAIPLYRAKGIRKWNGKFDSRTKGTVVVEGEKVDKEVFGDLYFEHLEED